MPRQLRVAAPFGKFLRLGGPSAPAPTYITHRDENCRLDSFFVRLSKDFMINL